MTQDRIYAFVEENMKTIFAYACSRVSHKQEAEDLAGDIIAALLAAAGRIRSEEALFGYVWTIAANTYKKYLRRKSRCAAVEWDENRLGEIPDDEDFTEALLQSERLNRLRRELSLLSGQYRECTVAYYFDGLSCAETAEKLHISLEMVKYYLFKTRKILKEGIGMERTFGEKSYKPSRFEFVTIFSGQFNREYRNLFNRKLPGSVLSSAYYTPMTVRELSVELGVAAVYMEDEVALLEKYDFHDICVSMKSSSVPLMIEAYRLFSERSDYPLHIGVTETGTARMGTIKSAMGIGALLCQGIGDTMRVSLTADPVQEVLTAKDILKAAGLRKTGVNIVACPTCGRTRIDLIGLANQVEQALAACEKPITVAVMGCVVNGPGEAREADIGIAGGDGCGILFVRGKQLKKLPYDELLPTLLEYIEKL